MLKCSLLPFAGLFSRLFTVSDTALHLFLDLSDTSTRSASQAKAPTPLPEQFRPVSTNQPFRTRYILVSYPLGVLWALSLFRSGAYTSRIEALLQQQQDNDEPRNDVLLLYGDTDQFTAKSVSDPRNDAGRKGC